MWDATVHKIVAEVFSHRSIYYISPVSTCYLENNFWYLLEPLYKIFLSLHLCLPSLKKGSCRCKWRKRVFNLRFINISAGVNPVIKCEVVRSPSKRGHNLVCQFPCLIRCKFCLITCTCLSTCPFEYGWCGGVKIYLMPFFYVNCWTSWDLNALPLSEMKTSGKPWVEKNSRSSLITVEEFKLGKILTPGHFE